MASSAKMLKVCLSIGSVDLWICGEWTDCGRACCGVRHVGVGGPSGASGKRCPLGPPGVSWVEMTPSQAKHRNGDKINVREMPYLRRSCRFAAHSRLNPLAAGSRRNNAVQLVHGTRRAGVPRQWAARLCLIVPSTPCSPVRSGLGLPVRGVGRRAVLIFFSIPIECKGRAPKIPNTHPALHAVSCQRTCRRSERQGGCTRGDCEMTLIAVALPLRLHGKGQGVNRCEMGRGSTAVR